MLASLRSDSGRHDRNTWTISSEYAPVQIGNGPEERINEKRQKGRTVIDCPENAKHNGNPPGNVINCKYEPAGKALFDRNGVS